MDYENITLTFEDETGKLHYTNERGDKDISFGLCKNKYGLFPEEGYSDDLGTVFVPRNFYKCAASAAWAEPQKLYMKVQIIDKYFGNLNITIGFADNELSLRMEKFAGDFLKEYQGFATGKALIEL